jgi:hypothetical protein
MGEQGRPATVASLLAGWTTARRLARGTVAARLAEEASSESGLAAEEARDPQAAHSVTKRPSAEPVHVDASRIAHAMGDCGFVRDGYVGRSARADAVHLNATSSGRLVA